MNEFGEGLRKLDASQMLRRLRVLERGEGGEVVCEGVPLVSFASNDYLGLSVHPEVVRAAREALERYGLGAGASRLMSGTFGEHERLETSVAEWMGRDSALVFATGYQANVGLLFALAESEDVILADRTSHASLIDGARLSRGRFRVFAHNDADELEDLLGTYSGARRRFVVTEGIFSMDGDRAPVVKMLEVTRRHGAWLILDDAHAIGVLGQHGGGTLEEEGIDEREGMVVVGTLSKVLGSQGGFVACGREIREWLINRARTFIYSTGLAPVLAAGARRAVELVRGDEGDALRKRLHENAAFLRERLTGMGLDTGGSVSQIIPVILGSAERAVEVSRNMAARGLFVPAVRPPTVAEGTSRLRISVTSDHKRENLEQLIAILAETACR